MTQRIFPLLPPILETPNSAPLELKLGTAAHDLGQEFFGGASLQRSRSPGCRRVLCPHQPQPLPALLGLGGKALLPKPSLQHSPLLPGIFMGVICASRVKKAVSQGGKNCSNSPDGERRPKTELWETHPHRLFFSPKMRMMRMGCRQGFWSQLHSLEGLRPSGQEKGPFLTALPSCPPWHRVQTVPEMANIQLEWPRQEHSVCL